MVTKGILTTPGIPSPAERFRAAWKAYDAALGTGDADIIEAARNGLAKVSWNLAPLIFGRLECRADACHRLAN